MHMNRIFGFLALLAVVGCTHDQTPKTDWFGEYGTLDTGTPIQMQYGSPDMQPGTPSDNLLGAPVHRMAVMLPLTGDAAQTGNAIRTSIESAVLQNAPQNLSVAFYDTAENLSATITDVLSTEPEVIIGPVFADDARAVRSAKPDALPVLSFTSDATALGDGVMTMALMPTNSVEAIVKEMSTDGIGGFIILAPDTASGRLMAEIIAVPIDDGVTFQVKSISEIMDEAEYPGIRVTMTTLFDGVRTPLKIDISTGDAITPKEVRYSFKLMLEDRSIDVWAYNLETVLAEKLETIITRTTTNTRMRDFYDIAILQQLYGSTLDPHVLHDALLATAHKRGTERHLAEAAEVFDEVENSPVMQDLWAAYQKKFSYASDLGWDTVMAAVRQLFARCEGTA